MMLKALNVYLLENTFVESLVLDGESAIFHTGFKFGIGSDGATVSSFSHDKSVVNINEKRINTMLKFFFMALKFS